MSPIAIASQRTFSGRLFRSVALKPSTAFCKATNDSAVLYSSNFWVESPECSPQAALAAAKATKGDYLGAIKLFSKQPNDSAVFAPERHNSTQLERDL